jgi:hypothetical protein
MNKTVGKCPQCGKTITVTLDDALLSRGDELQEGVMECPTQCPECNKWFYTNVHVNVSLEIGKAKESPKSLEITKGFFETIFKYSGGNQNEN